MRHLCLAAGVKTAALSSSKPGPELARGVSSSQQHKKVMMSDGGQHQHQRWGYTGSCVDTADDMLPQLYPPQWRSSVRVFSAVCNVGIGLEILFHSVRFWYKM